MQRLHLARRRRRRKPVLLVVMGPPGSGKEARGKIIRAKFRGRKVQFRRVVCSQLLKRIKKTDPVCYWEHIEPFQRRGKLVPDRYVVKLILRHIKPLLKGGYHTLLDGFPRTEKQALAFGLLLREARKTHRVIVLILNTPISVCRERVLGRGRVDDTAENFVGRELDWGKALAGAIVLRNMGVSVRWVKAGNTPEEGAYYILAKVGLN